TKGQKIPETKGKLLFEVYDALLKEHDALKELKRERESGLGYRNFTLILEKFAYDTLEQTTTEYDKEQALKFIEEAIPQDLKNVDSRNFLKDLLYAVPLLIEEKSTYRYRWWQKSFQDYFAARYLSQQDNKLTVLQEIYNQEKVQYLNLLDIFYDLDYDSFTKTIIKLLKNDFLKKYNKIEEIPDIDPDLQIKRKQLLAFHDLIYIYNSDKVSYNTVTKDNFKNPFGVQVKKNISLVYQSNFKLDLIRQIGRREKEIFLKKNKPETYYYPELHPLTTEKPEQPKYIYKIDNNPNEWYNQPGSFKIINDFLSHEQITPYIFDLPKS
ncbi:MAG: hypothetical protein ABI550_10105, partial [Ignavibacteriaceae bacterium]